MEQDEVLRLVAEYRLKLAEYLKQREDRLPLIMFRDMFSIQAERDSVDEVARQLKEKKEELEALKKRIASLIGKEEVADAFTIEGFSCCLDRLLPSKRPEDQGCQKQEQPQLSLSEAELLIQGGENSLA